MGMIVQTLSVLGREEPESLEEVIARRFETEQGEERWLAALPEEREAPAPSVEVAR